MKVCLIHPRMYVKAYNFFPLGLGFLASSLEKNSIDYSFYDLHRDWMKTYDFIESVKKEGKIELFAISCLMNSFKNTIKLCESLKHHFSESKIVLGGKIAALEPEFIFRNIKTDYVIKGEGEVAIIELIEMLEGKRSIEEVQGLAYKDESGKICFNGVSRPINDVSDYLIPIESFDMKKYISKETVQSPNLSSTNMISSRGCPFSCAFCNNSKNPDKRMRYYDLNKLGKQWDHLIKNFGLKHITFNDDIFTVNKERTKKICKLLKNKGLSFSCSTRLDCLDEELIKILDDSGCKYLCIGIESPAPAVAKIIDKRLDFSKCEKNISLLKKTNIIVNFGFMIGHYGETEETIQQTREFVMNHSIIYAAFFATPFPGTRLYDMVKNRIPDEEEYLYKLSEADLSADYLINMTDIPKKRIYSMHDYLVVDSLLNSLSFNLPFKFILRRILVLYLIFMRRYGLKVGFFKKLFEFLNIVIVKPIAQKRIDV